MNNPPPLPPLRARDYLENPRKDATLSRLPRSMLRSRAPGYLLATVAVFAVGGFIAWKVVRQAEAIHAVETKAPITVTEPETSAVPVLVDVPSGTPAAGGIPISRLGTTGAVVATPSAATEQPAPASADSVGASIPVTSLPQARPLAAPEPAATDSVHAKPHAGHAVPRHAHTRRERPETTSVAQPDRAPGSEGNPYDSDRAPSPAASAPPGDTSGIFDARE